MLASPSSSGSQLAHISITCGAFKKRCPALTPGQLYLNFCSWGLGSVRVFTKLPRLFKRTAWIERGSFRKRMQGQTPSLTTFLFPAHSGRVRMSSRIRGPGLARSETKTHNLEGRSSIHFFIPCQALSKKVQSLRNQTEWLALYPLGPLKCSHLLETRLLDCRVWS